MGETTFEKSSPLNIFTDGSSDGYFLNNKCWGTYIHGIFDNPEIISDLLKSFSGKTNNIDDFYEYKNAQFNKLADFLREHCDISSIYRHLIL